MQPNLWCSSSVWFPPVAVSVTLSYKTEEQCPFLYLSTIKPTLNTEKRIWNSARIEAGSGVMRCEREGSQATEEGGDALAAFPSTDILVTVLWPGLRHLRGQNILHSQ